MPPPGTFGRDPRHALDRRLCHGLHDLQRLGNLQRLAQPALPIPGLDRPRRLAGRRAGLAPERDVAAVRRRHRLSGLWLRQRSFPARPEAAAPRRTGAGPGRRAALSPEAPHGALQRRAAHALCRGHHRRHPAGDDRARHLEAGAVRLAGWVVRRLSDRPRHPPRHHVRHRRLRSQPRRAGGDPPAHAEVDDRHRARRDRGKPMSDQRNKDQRNKPAVSMAEIKPELERLHRRGFLRSTLSLGALTMLTGYGLSTHSGVDAALEAILRLDDRVQSALFSRQRLAETYPASAITRPFRFNAYYAEWLGRAVPDNWGLTLG